MFWNLLKIILNYMKQFLSGFIPSEFYFISEVLCAPFALHKIRINPVSGDCRYFIIRLHCNFLYWIVAAWEDHGTLVDSPELLPEQWKLSITSCSASVHFDGVVGYLNFYTVYVHFGIMSKIDERLCTARNMFTQSHCVCPENGTIYGLTQLTKLIGMTRCCTSYPFEVQNLAIDFCFLSGKLILGW